MWQLGWHMDKSVGPVSPSVTHLRSITSLLYYSDLDHSLAGMGPVRVTEQCHKLPEVYWKAIVEVARLECLKSSLDAGAPLEEVHSLDAQIELADQARRAARDALQTHRIEKGHS